MAKGSNKAITKSCPSCSKQIAVACKNCPCGHTFFVARRSSSAVGKGKDGEQRGSPTPPPPPQPVESTSKSNHSTVGIRRTERVKRDKPDFYDASGYDAAKPARKPKMTRQRLTASVSEEREDIDDTEQNNSAKRGRVSGRRSKRRRNLADLIDEKKIEDDEAGPTLSAQKQISLGINLSEINRKLIAVNPVFG